VAFFIGGFMRYKLPKDAYIKKTGGEGSRIRVFTEGVEVIVTSHYYELEDLGDLYRLTRHNHHWTSNKPWFVTKDFTKQSLDLVSWSAFYTRMRHSFTTERPWIDPNSEIVSLDMLMKESGSLMMLKYEGDLYLTTLDLKTSTRSNIVSPYPKAKRGREYE